MRRIQLCAVAIAILCARPMLAGAEGGVQHAIDASASKAQFGLQHVFVNRVTGGLPISSGAVTLEPGSAVPVAVQAVLDATKISTPERDQSACIRSPDYFDVNKYPEVTFTSTKIVPNGPAGFGMDGQLTIHGVTQPEHLDVEIRGDASHPVYHAVGHIDRHAFGMKGMRLDPVIGGMVDVTLDIVVRP